MKQTTFLLFLFLSIPIYSQNNQDIESRVKALVSQMTLEEKISQLGADNSPAIPRLGIAAYNWHNEALHGVVTNMNATIFPIPMGLAASWDLGLIHKVASLTSDEGRVLYNRGITGLNFWGPNIAIYRDPRWGRGQETYGEDPFLTSQCAVAFIKGMQGDHDTYLKTVPSPKHFFTHSGPEAIRHTLNTTCNTRDLFETYLPAFKSCIQQGDARSFMSAYNSYKGIPITANKYFLTDVLRKQWGFSGFIVADCFAIGFLHWGHKYSLTDEDAVADAINAGCDLDCGEYYRQYLSSSINQSLTNIAAVDTSVSRLFRTRFLLGEFSPKDEVPYNALPDSLLDCQQNRDYARYSAQKSIVLLKNESHTLPLKKDIKKLLVVGPNADDIYVMMGAYCSVQPKISTLLNGIKSKISPETQLIYTKAFEMPGMILEQSSPRYFRTPEGQRGFKAEYFNNKTLSGEPSLTRVDSAVFFNWDQASPDPVITRDSFSVKWTAIANFDISGDYVVELNGDDGIRLYVNDSLIIDWWSIHNAYPIGKKIKFEAGVDYNFRIEYFEHCDWSMCQFKIGNDSTTGEQEVAQIIDQAKNADAVIFMAGITTLFEHEGGTLEMKGFYHGDRTTIELPFTQQRLLKALKQSGKPVTAIVTSGGCFALNWLQDSIPAILQAWYPGEEGGNAIADILFGDANPSGKLPITYYKSDADLPDFADYNMANRTYRYFSKPVLYPFGFGLSYSTFEFGNISIVKDSMELCSEHLIPVAFSLTNTSTIAGEEVVQIYVSNIASKQPQAIKELKAFKKYMIEPGTTIQDTIFVDAKSFVYYDSVHSQYTVEPSVYSVQLGTSSADIKFSKSVKISNCSDTSINEPESSHISIYPNPANDKIYIELSAEYLPIKSIKVFDSFGNDMNLNCVDNGIHTGFEISCSTLANGAYYIQIDGAGGIITKSVVVNR